MLSGTRTSRRNKMKVLCLDRSVVMMLVFVPSMAYFLLRYDGEFYVPTLLFHCPNIAEYDETTASVSSVVCNVTQCFERL